MFKLLLLMIILNFISFETSEINEIDDQIQIQTIMDMQEDAWSRGDLDEFMTGYWKSDELKFVGSKGLTYGWQKTLDNYKGSYKTKEEMGILTFKNEVMESIEKNHYAVIGQWHLKRNVGLQDLSGYYTLIWKKINGEWKIISDHSS